MRILTITNMYPTTANPQFGIFVREQVGSIRELGHDVDVLFINGREGRLRLGRYPLGAPRMWKQMRMATYDLVHAHYVFSGIIGRTQRKLPLVVTHHGVEVALGWQARLSRWTRNWADETIVVAPWMKRALGMQNAWVIPCGIDLNLFCPGDQRETRQHLGLAQDKRYVLFAGYTWDPVKRFHLVEAAMQIVRRSEPDVELLSVWGRPHEVVPAYMNAADVMVLASTVEGSPQVVKEAMACNLPIVATDAGDAWTVTESTEGCYRTGPAPEEIAARIRDAISPPRRTTGRCRVKRYGLEQTAQQVVTVYEQATGRAQSRKA